MVGDKGNVQVTQSGGEIVRLRKVQVVSLDRVTRFHGWLGRKRRSRQACRVVGESRTGKTVACQTYASQYPPSQQEGEPPIVPVLYWHAPEDSGPRDLFDGIFDGVNYQLKRGTISEVRRRVYEVLRSCQVEMLLIDEAHRIRPKTFSDIRDIFDKLGISVVLIGTDRLDAVVRRDEQIYNRFMACHRFERMNRSDLKVSTGLWEKHVLQLPESSKLTSASMQRLLDSCTQGYIGLLDAVLRSAAIEALERGEQHISKAILEEVIAEYR